MQAPNLSSRLRQLQLTDPAIDLPLFLVARFSRGTTEKPPLGETIKFFLIRKSNKLLPPRVIRSLSDASLPDAILYSPRYQPYSQLLFQEVIGNDFCGRWVVRNSITNAGQPCDSDIVIYYLHGGGYFSSSPATYLLFLLRLAETILHDGKTISIFALDYELAPEHPHPRQLTQATKSYRWLIGEPNLEGGGAGVKREKVLLMGDSAGGHLAVSMLVNMHVTNPKVDLRPGLGLVLLSPWLSLYRQPDSFKRNEETDVLSGEFLQQTALRFMGSIHYEEWQSYMPPVEFVEPNPRIGWDAVLPGWVWVSAGTNEILYDDIVRWVKEREKDCIGNHRIQAELNKIEPHVYAWLRTTDPALRKKFLGKPYGDASVLEEFDAIERIGRAILLSHTEGLNRLPI